MAVTFKRLDGPIGAEVSGIDLHQAPDPEQVEELEDGLVEHHVLVFRDHDLSLQQQVAFVRPFGTLETFAPHPSQPAEAPEIFRVSNDPEKGYTDVGRYWHTDNSALAEPAKYSWLFSVAVPPEGGETMFMDMYAALKRLPPAIRQKIEGRRAHHETGKSRYIGIGPQDNPGSDHPLVRTHPLSGRKALYVNMGLIRSVEGLSAEESAQLMDDIRQFLEGMDYLCHKWSPGDVVVWDNASTAHRVRPTEPKYLRILNRITVQGDVPF